MQKKETSERLLINTILFAINSFGSRIIVFCLIPLYTHFLSESELGTADLVYSTVTIMLSIFALKISSAVLRFGGKDSANDAYILSNGLKIIGYSTVIVSVITLGAVIVAGFEQSYYYIPVLYIICGTKDVIAQYCKASGKVKIYAIEGAISSLVHLIIAFFSLSVLKLKIDGYLTSIVVANLIGLIYLVVFGRVKVHFRPIKNAMTQQMLSYSLPLVPNSLSWRIIELSDRYMVTWIVSAAANGVYTIAYKIPSMMGIVSDIFIQAWLLTTIDEFDGEKNYKNFERIFKCYTALLYILSAVVICFNRLIGHILFSESFFAATRYSPLLIFALSFNNLQAFFGSFYNAAKKTKQLLYSSVVAAVANIVLNSILIPLVGVYGAIIATCASYVIITVIRLVGSRKYIYFSINLKLLIFNITILFTQGLSEVFIKAQNLRVSIDLLCLICIVLFNVGSLKSLITMISQMVKGKMKTT